MIRYYILPLGSKQPRLWRKGTVCYSSPIFLQRAMRKDKSLDFSALHSVVEVDTCCDFYAVYPFVVTRSGISLKFGGFLRARDWLIYPEKALQRIHEISRHVQLNFCRS